MAVLVKTHASVCCPGRFSKLGNVSSLLGVRTCFCLPRYVPEELAAAEEVVVVGEEDEESVALDDTVVSSELSVVLDDTVEAADEKMVSSEVSAVI
jgi:phosphosulfolactate phosphohydrolase-like enzyme